MLAVQECRVECRFDGLTLAAQGKGVEVIAIRHAAVTPIRAAGCVTYSAPRVRLVRLGIVTRLWPLVLASCVIFQRPVEAPQGDETIVALLTGGLAHPMNDIARHPWFAIRKKGEQQWMVYEVGGGIAREADPFRSHNIYVGPMLHKVWRGEEAERAAACIERVGTEVKRDIDENYRLFPGPNSNTFGDVVLRRCKLSAALPATSIGKDWRGLIGVGISSERTGIQIETPLLGFKIGLKEGVELHVLGLSLGIDLWPPAIIVPLGPGRLGFDDR